MPCNPDLSSPLRLPASRKSVLMTMLVSGVGVAALTVPVSPILAEVSAVRDRVADLTTRRGGPVIRIEFAPTAGQLGTAGRDPAPMRQSFVTVPVKQVDFTDARAFVPVTPLEPAERESAAIYQPAVPSRSEPLQMPSAELKAMMAQVAASRGEPYGLIGPLDEEVDGIDNARMVQPDKDAIAVVGNRRVEFDVAALVNGKPAGRMPLRIADSDNISVRLGDILLAIQPLMDPAAYEALSASGSAEDYVTLNTLRANGIPVKFDSRDRLIIGKN